MRFEGTGVNKVSACDKIFPIIWLLPLDVGPDIMVFRGCSRLKSSICSILTGENWSVRESTEGGDFNEVAHLPRVPESLM